MPKIFDCFIFYNELDLLEIRLNELDRVVDRFVLCEAPVTFRGKPKPLYFAENRERYARFLHKIVHVVVDDMPTGRESEAVYWKRQKFQRNAIRRGLVDAAADDFVVLSDLDEIPRAAAVEAIARAAESPAVYGLLMGNHRFFVNLVNVSERRPWNKSRMARLGDIRTMERLRGGGPTWRPNYPSLPRTLRQWKRMSFGMRRLRRWIAVPDAGWHLSYLNGPEAVSRKLHTMSRVRSESFTSPAAQTERIRGILENAAGARTNYRLVTLDSRFPAYLVANQTRFSHLIADGDVFERFGVAPPSGMAPIPRTPRF